LLFGGPGGEQVERLFNTCVEVERLNFEIELAGFDLREVQDIVDDGEQGITAGPNVSTNSCCSGER
jgi:hypothetical protein